MAILEHNIMNMSSGQIALCIVLGTLGILFLYRLKRSKRVCVIVLGDIGRSPRMMYHSLSLAQSGFDVDLIGFYASAVLDKLANNPRINIIPLPSPIIKVPGISMSTYYILKTVVQASQLLMVMLMKVQKPKAILLQNPPSIPSMAVTWIISIMKGSILIIDWHNYGYTILGLNVKSDDHPLVKLSYSYEGYFGQRAHNSICVTKAMQEDLLKRWKIRAEVMYDRPPSIFRKLNVAEKHEVISWFSSPGYALIMLRKDYGKGWKCKREGVTWFVLTGGNTQSLRIWLFKKLGREYRAFRGEGSGDESRFTYVEEDGSVRYKGNRPALLASSTSWTDDEDFSILLDALTNYEDEVHKNPKKYPDVLCCITGKGPLKERYLKSIEEKDFKHVTVVTPWLEHEDYPRLIASADFGVCLHFSSSGLDLPMKVVDMFGCGLPVCAVQYNCLHELVKHGENGLLFTSSKELTSQIKELLEGFPLHQERLEKFRANLEPFQTTRWDSAWQRSVRPLFGEI